MPTAPAAVDPGTAPAPPAAPTAAAAAAPTGAAASANGETAAPTVRKIEQAETEPINLLDAAGAPAGQAPGAGADRRRVVLLFVVRRLRRRKG